MKVITLKNKEAELKEVVFDLPIKLIWLLVIILWTVLGTYFYNEYLPYRNWMTELIFYGVTFLILWQNKMALSYFFRNPFKNIDKPFVYSSVLWVIPFTILMASVPLVLIPEALGWISPDPQSTNEMSLTIGEYFGRLATLPIGVIEEEAVNVLLLLAASKLIARKLKYGWLIVVVLMTAVFFGAVHVTAWGMESAISRMLIHIPFLFSVLYFRNVWPCILAHMYQNWLTYTSVIFKGFATLFVLYGTILLIVILVYRQLVSYRFRDNGRLHK